MKSWNEWLVEAVRDGNVELSAWLLDRGASPNARDRDQNNGDTALMKAAHHRDGVLVSLLLAKGASPLAENSSGSSALAWADASSKSYEILRDALVAREGFGPAIDAALASDDERAFAALVARGADPNCGCIAPVSTCNPWDSAASKHRVDLEKAMRYLALGCALDGQTIDKYGHLGRTLLGSAVSGKARREAAALVKMGADPLVSDGPGNTPLSYAYKTQWLKGAEAMEQILAKRMAVPGFDWEARDLAGRTVLERCLGANEDGALPEDSPVLAAAAAALENGAPFDPNAKAGNGYSIMELALRRDAKRVALALARRGADHAARATELTLAHLAAANDDSDTLAVLIGNGADVSVKDQRGDTPLHHALRAGKDAVACVKILLAAGACTEDRNAKGRTPLHYACERGSNGSMGALLLAGADVRAKDDADLDPFSLLPNAPSAEVLNLFFERGLKPDSIIGCRSWRPKSEATLLAVACHGVLGSGVARPAPEIVELLLDKGADPNVTTCNPWHDTLTRDTTSLHIAAQSLSRVSSSAQSCIAQDKLASSALACVAMLVAAGADSQAKDGAGVIPADLLDGNARTAFEDVVRAAFERRVLAAEVGMKNEGAPRGKRL